MRSTVQSFVATGRLTELARRLGALIIVLPVVLAASVLFIGLGATGCSGLERIGPSESPQDYPGFSEGDEIPGSRPPPHGWRTDGLVSRSRDASITVHQIITSDTALTLVYSAVLSTEVPQFADIIPRAELVAYGTGGTGEAVSHRVLHRAPGVSLGALSFELSGAPDYLSLEVRALSVSDMASGIEQNLVGPWQIPLLRKRSHDLQVSAMGFGSWGGRRYSDEDKIKSFGKSIPRADDSGNTVVLGMYEVLGEIIYLVIQSDGSVVEISEEHYSRLEGTDD